MIRRRRFCFAPLTAVTLSLVMPAMSFADNEVPASCPVTLPSAPAFVPPVPYPEKPSNTAATFWHGTQELWTWLGSDGVFRGAASPSPLQPGAITTRNKQFFWSPGFHPIGTPNPQLKIKARRLDGDAPDFKQPWVTNAHVPEWGGWTMLVMLDLPSLGCWEVTSAYNGNFLSFVVWVAPPKDGKLVPHYVPGPH